MLRCLNAHNPKVQIAAIDDVSEVALNGDGFCPPRASKEAIARYAEQEKLIAKLRTPASSDQS
jgi:hypothetical protein